MARCDICKDPIRLPRHPDGRYVDGGGICDDCDEAQGDREEARYRARRAVELGDITPEDEDREFCRLMDISDRRRRADRAEAASRRKIDADDE